MSLSKNYAGKLDRQFLALTCSSRLIANWSVSRAVRGDAKDRPSHFLKKGAFTSLVRLQLLLNDTIETRLELHEAKMHLSITAIFNKWKKNTFLSTSFKWVEFNKFSMVGRFGFWNIFLVLMTDLLRVKWGLFGVCLEVQHQFCFDKILKQYLKAM